MFPKFPSTILLMVQKSGEKTTWHVWNPVNNRIFSISTGDRRISEPSTVFPNIQCEYHLFPTPSGQKTTC